MKLIDLVKRVLIPYNLSPKRNSSWAENNWTDILMRQPDTIKWKIKNSLELWTLFRNIAETERETLREELDG